MTGLNFPVSAYGNPIDQELIVSNQSSHNVLTWGRTATGNVAPIRIVGGPHTGIYGPGSAILQAGLIPQPMAVDAASVSGASSNHNGVLEPGDPGAMTTVRFFVRGTAGSTGFRIAGNLSMEDLAGRPSTRSFTVN